MRVFKTRSVARFCKSEGITDKQLAAAIARAEKGLIDADLGGGLIKQRIARQGQGKSSGWRTVIAYRAGHRAVFLFGFAKSDLDNIAPDDLAAFKETAQTMRTASEAYFAAALKDNRLQEIDYEQKD